MSKQNRRTFLKAAAASSVFSTFAIGGTKASGRILGANDTIRVGVAGVHGRGKDHIHSLAGMENVQVSYIIDPDSSLFAARIKDVSARGGNEPKCVQDVRQALDDPDLDAISIAACNHWHSLMTIWACQAEKDVYVEKPLSHNIHEGRVAVQAARRYGRIVQHGTQSRSSESQAKEIAAVHSGKYGKLLVSKGYCCKPRWSIGYADHQPPPAHLAWDLWIGPARNQSFHRNVVHYNWHWFWDTGNGDIGNQGVHQLDIARWGIKGATLPKSVFALGGRLGFHDQGQTPNMQMALFDYGETLLVFEVRGLVDRTIEGVVDKADIPPKITNEFYTTEGMIREGKFYPQGGGDSEPLEDLGGSVNPGGEFGSFINAMRSRRVEDLNADVEEGHYSSVLCHLANISCRLGTETAFSRSARPRESSPVVAETFVALMDNLDRIGLDPESARFILGRRLAFDPQTERFVDDQDANALLTREPRPPFVVPERIV